MPQFKRFPLACLSVLLAGFCPISAAVITFDATDSGWYRSVDGFHDPVNENFFVGGDPNAAAEFRDFFVFDLFSQPVPGTILSVTLRIQNLPLDNTAASPQGGETYEVFGFGGSIGDLTGGTSSFGDLGSGAFFGSRDMLNSNVAQLLDVSFNASGVSAVESGLGGLFAVTGLITTIDDGTFATDGEDFFEGPNMDDVGDTTRQLIIETVAIPEPSTVLLLGSGLLGLVALAGRRLG